MPTKMNREASNSLQGPKSQEVESENKGLWRLLCELDQAHSRIHTLEAVLAREEQITHMVIAEVEKMKSLSNPLLQHYDRKYTA